MRVNAARFYQSIQMTLTAALALDEQDLMDCMSSGVGKIQLFEEGERTNYKQGVHTMEAVKIAEGE